MGLCSCSRGPSKQPSLLAEPEGLIRMLGCGLVEEAFASVELLWLRLFTPHSLELEVTSRRGHLWRSTLLGAQGLLERIF